MLDRIHLNYGVLYQGGDVALVRDPIFRALFRDVGVTITRIRAELGSAPHTTFTMPVPNLLLTDALGTRRIGNRNLSVMSLFFWLNHLSYRAHPMPHQLEGLKLAHQTRFNPTQLLWVLAIAIFVGALSAAWGHLHLSYEVGFRTGTVMVCSRRFQQTCGMALQSERNKRQRYALHCGWIWFRCRVCCSCDGGLFSGPLHPVGYVVSSWWTFTGLWFPLLISWIVKRILLSTGGVRLYRRSISHFSSVW